MPYAYRLEDDGTLDPEARSRCDNALRIAQNNTEMKIVLAAGWQEYAHKRGAESLAQAAETYLKTKNWPHHKIHVSAKGFNTVTETSVFYRVISLRSYMGYLGAVTTSWWHVPRVWLVCKIIFKPYKTPLVYAAPTTLGLRALAYNILRECIAIPKSIREAWKIKKTLDYLERHDAGQEENLR